MILRVGHNEISIGSERNPLGSVERGAGCGPAITAESCLAGTGHVVQYSVLQIHPPNAVALAQRDPQLIVVNVKRSRAQNRISARGLSSHGKPPLSIARDGLNDPRRRVNPPNAVIADIGDID